MSKPNKKQYLWKTQREFATMFNDDMHNIIQNLWDILNYFSTRVLQSIDCKYLNGILQIVRPIPEDVQRVIADLRRLIEKSREIERMEERYDNGSGEEASGGGGCGNVKIPHASRLEHLEASKDNLKDSCMRFRRNCELLHENVLLKEKLYGSSVPRVAF